MNLSTEDLPLFARVKSPVRRSDPETSREAARVAQKGTNELQREILRVLRMFGPQTDETIFEQLPAFVTLSPSGCRTRRKELENLGLVRAVPGNFGCTASGNRCRIWEAV